MQRAVVFNGADSSAEFLGCRRENGPAGVRNVVVVLTEYSESPSKQGLEIMNTPSSACDAPPLSVSRFGPSV